MAPKQLRSNSGFTLIEVIVVTGLLVLMGGILFGTVGSFIRGRNLVLDGRSNQRTATLFFSRLNRELLSSVAEAISSEALESAGEQSGNISNRRYMLGIDDSGGSTNRDKIRFVSEDSGQAVIGGQSNHGRVEIEYRLVEPEDSSPTQFGEKRRYLLVREEYPADIKDPEIYKKRKIVVPLAENVLSLNFRYRLSDKWFDSWRGRRYGFPELIEVELELAGNRGDPEVFKTAVTINPRESTGSAASTNPFGSS
ncbi:MAG: prepilin-type N-terminal cleavage/methylation domain-containing protein [Bdellovibrionales bacterium]|nr:prepilin-type N-terminal cleavage/methylation domain-containing protein [Bdellovibrionales bacterium]